MCIFAISGDVYDGFCIQGRILPSIFVMGIAKCGTSTFDMIVQQYPELSHGNRKEHWFYVFSSKKLEKLDKNIIDSYAKQFPKCISGEQNSSTYKVVKTYDATGGYAFPSAKSAENIKRFYKYLGIPPTKLVFISLICPNTRRIPSCFYYSLEYMEKKANEENKIMDIRLTKLNVWLSLVLKYPFATYWNSGGPLRKNCLTCGYYDDIFEKYLEIFPKNRFFLIDSYYAFDNQQQLADSLSIVLKVPERNISYRHSNKHEHKEELTEELKAQIKSFYAKHEQKFKEIIKHKHNVQTFPDQSFGNNW